MSLSSKWVLSLCISQNCSQGTISLLLKTKEPICRVLQGGPEWHFKTPAFELLQAVQRGWIQQQILGVSLNGTIKEWGSLPVHCKQKAEPKKVKNAERREFQDVLKFLATEKSTKRTGIQAMEDRSNRHNCLSYSFYRQQYSSIVFLPMWFFFQYHRF